MTDAPVRVLYITGWLRTGSTLLGNVLNELPGVFHAGELHYLWRNGVLRTGTNTLCGCGEDLAACPLWSAVLAGRDPADARRMEGWQRTLLRTRHTPRRLAEARGRTPAPGVREALDRMAGLYADVARHSGAGTIVDGSKYPAEPAALLGRPGLDLRIVHLVRDPRAIAHSYRKGKGYIDPRTPLDSTRHWTGANVASELVGRAAAGRYLRIRHEDLAADPAGTVARVMAFAGLPGDPPVAADGTAVLGGNHTVTGNPDRLRRGPVAVRPDGAWRAGLAPRDAAVATLLAGPLLHRYRYPLRP
ncbi:sulfotransferase [Actinomadura parmotrematis]|uniref:Sulfotransferase n=1 Tax=Actinomadura parmotrematis TaxID=2864039 RepID=A0ABS7G2C3_9ACTN|nr:sulfotransferase [Actinomadura parmotrematis]MBW8486827.1 sulfotransferase [Actinomadura parmotrematis]